MGLSHPHSVPQGPAAYLTHQGSLPGPSGMPLPYNCTSGFDFSNKKLGETYLHTNVQMGIHGSLPLIAHTSKKLSCPSVSEWVNTLWSIRYIIQRERVMSHPTTRRHGGTRNAYDEVKEANPWRRHIV